MKPSRKTPLDNWIARKIGLTEAIPPGRMKSVPLTADYVPRSVVAVLENIWRCGVYQHYGMTESGPGGGGM